VARDGGGRGDGGGGGGGGGGADGADDRTAVAVTRGDLLRDLRDVLPDERMVADHLLDGMIGALRHAADAAAAAEAERPTRR